MIRIADGWPWRSREKALLADLKDGYALIIT